MFDVIRNKYPDLEYGKYTSHNGRDTFISLAIENGTDIKTILNWTGQSSYRVMERYIKVPKEYEKKMMENIFS